MKLSFVFAVLSAVVAPVANANLYKCETSAVFDVEDDATKPQVPSKETLEWLAKELYDTFHEAYAADSDVDMTSETFSKFTMKRETANEEDKTVSLSGKTVSLTDMISNLRGSRSSIYGMVVYASSGISCRWCKLDDDAYALGKENGYTSIEDFVAASSEHKEWEKLFCAGIKKNPEFASAKGCAIALTNCQDDGEANNDVDASVVGDNYLVSDMRAVQEGEGVVYAVQTINQLLAGTDLETN